MRERANSPKSIRWRLTIAYDGSNYQGWQVQKTGVGVQHVIEQALAKLFPNGPRLHSSSRTDTGVHALGMVAHIDIPVAACRMAADKLPLAINAHLPEDVRVFAAKRVPRTFHARFSASGKQYRYFVWNGPAMNPLLRHQTWLVPRKLDVPAMKQAAHYFVGRQDFAAFAVTREYKMRSTVRTLHRCEIKCSGALLTFVLEGDGFLYKMCRGIVGTLVQVGLGKHNSAAVAGMLQSKDRRMAGMTAPAHGLVLWKVFYGRRAVAASSEQEDTDE